MSSVDIILIKYIILKVLVDGEDDLQGGAGGLAVGWVDLDLGSSPAGGPLL